MALACSSEFFIYIYIFVCEPHFSPLTAGQKLMKCMQINPEKKLTICRRKPHNVWIVTKPAFHFHLYNSVQHLGWFIFSCWNQLHSGRNRMHEWEFCLHSFKYHLRTKFLPFLETRHPKRSPKKTCIKRRNEARVHINTNRITSCLESQGQKLHARKHSHTLSLTLSLTWWRLCRPGARWCCPSRAERPRSVRESLRVEEHTAVGTGSRASGNSSTRSSAPTSRRW